ncbi:hypothetical protein MNR01_12440 [Lysobacter sp. S4-A87]|uniref:hypothetical protein n=1 Tax=Lysobacter sp. S4-A87 TaxID=2925843 RepID=UPI001F538D20|nr:hypothetical protein [Lysobacter sp. S4-A87]UNK48554.1 hypothetical protein MNR01_12440 [Lysobacter sp. S4-A87]
MNWGKIARYAAVLFVVQVVLGLFEADFFVSAESAGEFVASLIGRSLISFAACAAVFVHLSFRQSVRPFAHAWLALLLQAGAGTLLSMALPGLLGSTPFAFASGMCAEPGQA